MIGVDTLPELPTDPGDRNRTSPFAFTGNRFEFRAPGSMQSVAGPMTTINTILAEALDYIATDLETALAEGTEFNEAVQSILTEIITNHGNAVFNGNGYSDAWQLEAAERGLPNLRTTIDALPALIAEPAIELFEKYHVFSAREMHSRYEIGLEQYAMSIGVEARLTYEMGSTMVLPAGLRYQTEVALNLGALIDAQVPADTSTLEPVSSRLADLRAALTALGDAIAGGKAHDVQGEATYARDALLPAIHAVRAAADSLEGVVADDLWPLPTYQEMLHIL